MAEKTNTIERIVREVLAELGLAQKQGSSPAADASPSSPSDSQDVTLDDGNLVIGHRVVTLAEVSGRLDGVRRLVVPPQAVVTPTVRDELLRKNIDLTHAAPRPSCSSGSLRLVMMTVGQGFDPEALIAALGQECLDVKRHATDCLIAATDRLAEEVLEPDTLGLLLTRHVAAGLCLANRHRGVRAVCRSGAAYEVGANLLIVDPTAKGVFQLKQSISEFCRGGVRPCPEVFQQRLT